MPEFLHIDPEDLVEDPVIQDYSYNAAASLGRYLVLIAGFLFFGISNAFSSKMNSGQLTTGSGSPSKLAIATMFAVFVIAPIIYWIWTDYVQKRETGSKIHTGERKIYWWDGPAPAEIRTINIDEVLSVEFADADWGPEDAVCVVLRTKSGETLQLPYRCVRDAREWAKALSSHFPHIQNT